MKKDRKKRIMIVSLFVCFVIVGIGGFIWHKDYNQLKYSKYQTQKLETLKYQKQWDKNAAKLPDNSDFEIKGTKVVKYKGDFGNPSHIVIPDNITEIGEDAFRDEKCNDYDQSKQSYVSIPNNVKIDHSAFAHAGPLSIKLEEGRTEITRGAFYGINLGKKTTIIFPSTIKIIQSYGVMYNHETETPKIYLNEGLETIKFRGLIGISCQLPSTIKTLDNLAVSGMFSKSVKQVDDVYVVLPNSLETLGSGSIVFDEVKKKTYIPSSVKKIDSYGIIGKEDALENGEGYLVDPKNKYYKSDGQGWLYSKDGKEVIYIFGVNKIKVPKGVETIPENSISIVGRRDDDIQDNTQHIYIPKSVKTFDLMCSMWITKIHFAGSAPKVTHASEDTYYFRTYYIPKGHLEEYKKAFAESLDNCKFVEE